MPKRPREHVVAEESRRRFEGVLPPEWVPRTVTDDYGVDQVVEVFEDGEATGLQFGVQLKATDQRSLPKALKIAFRRETWAYFASLDYPVLVVRYHAASGRLFARWTHRSPGRSLRLTTDDELLSSSRASILAELRALRQLARADTPLRLQVFATDDAPIGTAGLVFALKNLTERVDPLLSFVGEPVPPPPLAVIAHEGYWEVHLGCASVKVPFAPDSGVRGCVADVATGLAAMLAFVGRADTGIRLALEAVPHSRAIEVPPLLGMLLGALIRTGRAGDLIKLLDALAQRPLAAECEVYLQGAVMQLADHMSDADKRAVEAFRRRWIERESDPLAVAPASYSLANWRFHQLGDWQGAYDAYREAVRLYPGYAEREYFCAEIAAAAFESGDYDASLDWYRRAQRMTGDPDFHARVADVQAHQGSYAEAIESFNAYGTAAEHPQPIWWLAYVGLQWACGQTGITTQVRDVDAASISGSAGLKTDDMDKRLRLLWDSVRADVMCGSSWWNIGLVHAHAQRFEDAVMPMVIGCVDHGAPSEFADTALVAIFAGRADLCEALIEAAVWRFGSEFMNAALQVAEAQRFRSAPFLDLVGAIASQVERQSGGTIRLLGIEPGTDVIMAVGRVNDEESV